MYNVTKDFYSKKVLLFLIFYSSKNTGYTIIFNKNKNTKYFLSSTYEKDLVTVKI